MVRLCKFKKYSMKGKKNIKRSKIFFEGKKIFYGSSKNILSYVIKENHVLSSVIAIMYILDPMTQRIHIHTFSSRSWLPPVSDMMQY